MTTILLVRHATTAATGKRLGGWTDAPLDDGGIAQAQTTADRLAGLDIAAIYTSPIVRTMNTAKIISTATGVKIQKRKGLGEVDYGDWTDKTLASLRKRKLWSVIQSTPSRVTFPNGESIRGAQARVVEQLEQLAAAHDDKDTIVAVSHADIIKAALAHFLGTPLDTFQRIVINPASVSVLHLHDGMMPMVTLMNDTGRGLPVRKAATS